MSVALGLIALIVAAIDVTYFVPQVELTKVCSECEPPFLISLFSLEHAELVVKLIAGVAASCGLLSFVSGFWQGGFGQRKRYWLELRMVCESLRQWRWKYYLANMSEMISSIGNAELEAEYICRWKKHYSF